MTTQPLRELFIIRHAKTDRHETGTSTDPHLSPKGKKQACKLGEWLKHKNILFDAVYLSPDNRVCQTFRRLKPANTSPYKETLPTLATADLDTLIELLANIPPDYTKVCIVAHEPGLKALIQFLEEKGSCEHCDSGLFPSGALVHFILPNHWQDLKQGCGKLVQVIRSQDI